MRITKLVKYDLMQLLSSWLLYISLLLCVVPAIGVAVLLRELGLPPFHDLSILYFFAFFGSILVVINAMLPYTKDITNNTIVLMMNERENRVKYYIAKVIMIIIVATIFGVVAALAGYFLSDYANLRFPVDGLWKVILNFWLYTLFYGTLFLTISVFFNNVLAIFSIAILSIMLLPSFLTGITIWDRIPDGLETFIIDYVPFRFLPNVLSSVNWEPSHYISTIVCIVVFVIVGIIRIRTRDY